MYTCFMNEILQIDLTYLISYKKELDLITLWLSDLGVYHVDSLSHENINIKYANKSSGLKCVQLSK